MSKPDYNLISPGTYLDKAIVRVAARSVRQLVAEGHAPDAALRLATPGAWAEYQQAVLAFLRAGNGLAEGAALHRSQHPTK